MIELYTGGETDLAAGPHAVFLVSGTARAADGRDVWIVQALAARLDALPADEPGQVETVSAAALLRFAGDGAQWLDGAEVRRLAVSHWPPAEGQGSD